MAPVHDITFKAPYVVTVRAGDGANRGAGDYGAPFKIQLFADRATAVYGKPSLRISIQRATNLNIGAVYRQGNIFVNVRMLDSPNLKKTIAHELGHYILGHDGFECRVAGRMDARPAATRGRRQCQGRREPEAVTVVADALRRSADAQARYNLPLTPGHLPASAELEDLLARYPNAGMTLR
jgi:hypothetical protein